MLKYELGQDVCYLRYNKIAFGKVIARRCVDRIDTFVYYADGPQNDWIHSAMAPYTNTYIVHDFRSGFNLQYDEGNLFLDENELISSLHPDGD